MRHANNASTILHDFAGLHRMLTFAPDPEATIQLLIHDFARLYDPLAYARKRFSHVFSANPCHHGVVANLLSNLPPASQSHFACAGQAAFRGEIAENEVFGAPYFIDLICHVAIDLAFLHSFAASLVQFADVQETRQLLLEVTTTLPRVRVTPQMFRELNDWEDRTAIPTTAARVTRSSVVYLCVPCLRIGQVRQFCESVRAGPPQVHLRNWSPPQPPAAPPPLLSHSTIAPAPVFDMQQAVIETDAQCAERQDNEIAQGLLDTLMRLPLDATNKTLGHYYRSGASRLPEHLRRRFALGLPSTLQAVEKMRMRLALQSAKLLAFNNTIAGRALTLSVKAMVEGTYDPTTDYAALAGAKPPVYLKTRWAHAAYAISWLFTLAKDATAVVFLGPPTPDPLALAEHQELIAPTKRGKFFRIQRAPAGFEYHSDATGLFPVPHPTTERYSLLTRFTSPISQALALATQAKAPLKASTFEAFFNGLDESGIPMLRAPPWDTEPTQLAKLLTKAAEQLGELRTRVSPHYWSLLRQLTRGWCGFAATSRWPYDTLVLLTPRRAVAGFRAHFYPAEVDRFFRPTATVASIPSSTWHRLWRLTLITGLPVMATLALVRLYLGPISLQRIKRLSLELVQRSPTWVQTLYRAYYEWKYPPLPDGSFPRALQEHLDDLAESAAAADVPYQANPWLYKPPQVFDLDRE